MSDYKPLRSKATPGTLLHPSFRYTPSAETNVAATFARYREQVKARAITERKKGIAELGRVLQKAGES